MTKYEKWINEYIERNDGYVLGRCQSATTEMLKVFPELTRVAGWCAGQEHFWLVTSEEEIVDPTKNQFMELGIFELEYVPWKPGDEVRVGKCMNCGMDIYRNVENLNGSREYLCGAECYDSYAQACG